jgi:hypothetical protein
MAEERTGIWLLDRSSVSRHAQCAPSRRGPGTAGSVFMAAEKLTSDCAQPCGGRLAAISAASERPISERDTTALTPSSRNPAGRAYVHVMLAYRACISCVHIVHVHAPAMMMVVAVAVVVTWRQCEGEGEGEECPAKSRGGGGGAG